MKFLATIATAAAIRMNAQKPTKKALTKLPLDNKLLTTRGAKAVRVFDQLLKVKQNGTMEMPPLPEWWSDEEWCSKQQQIIWAGFTLADQGLDADGKVTAEEMEEGIEFIMEVAEGDVVEVFNDIDFD